jgi:DUF4097 and DUF4098 domain-containing protein YvlB
MRTSIAVAVFVAVSTLSASTAAAQRFPFERTFQTPVPSKLDVSTLRGKIEVLAGDPGRIVVSGTVTVRVGWDVPVNAVELARQVAAAPPIDHSSDTLRLQRPSDDAAQRAVVVAYVVRVPPGTDVKTVTGSGATRIEGVTGSVDVRTQSSSIDLRSLGGAAAVETGSGVVTVDGTSGSLSVRTGSSGFRGTRLGASLRVRTQSGEINAMLTGQGDVDVETGSSAIHLIGVRGGLTASTQSGRITVRGAPQREWNATTGSSAVELDIERGAGFALDATTGSGSVVVSGSPVQGSVEKRAVRGSVNGGGPLIRIFSRSGSFDVDVH